MFNLIETVEGIFIKESKNRFLCEVLINGIKEECYVPSSSRMENYINLINKKVILTKNTGNKIRTKYSLFAVKYYNKYILLNLNKVNDILSYYITENILQDSIVYSIKKEAIINGYKSDLVIKEFSNNGDKIIEAKAIIDIRKETQFPKVHSERAITQLTHIKNLLDSGYKVDYYFVSLSPIVRRITIDRTASEYYRLLNECLNKGLEMKGISVNLDGKQVVSFRKLQIVI